MAISDEQLKEWEAKKKGELANARSQKAKFESRVVRLEQQLANSRHEATKFFRNKSKRGLKPSKNNTKTPPKKAETSQKQHEKEPISDKKTESNFFI